MDNEQVREVFCQVYNVFWNKWKNEVLPRESDRWDEVVQDVRKIMTDYDCRMCHKIILALLTELEERSFGNGDSNVRADKISKKSELTLEEKLVSVKELRLADLLYVIRDYEKTPDTYEYEVIRQIGVLLMEKGIMLML